MNMIYNFSPFRFASFSSADTQQHEVINAIYRKYNANQVLTEEQFEEMPFDERMKWLITDPPLVARQFNFRWLKFLRMFILNGKLNPIGPVGNWFYRVEFQARGK